MFSINDAVAIGLLAKIINKRICIIHTKQQILFKGGQNTFATFKVTNDNQSPKHSQF